MKSVRFNAGDTIYADGEAGDTAFLLTTGSAETSVRDGVMVRTIETLGPGDEFGEFRKVRSYLRYVRDPSLRML